MVSSEGLGMEGEGMSWVEYIPCDMGWVGVRVGDIPNIQHWRSTVCHGEF